MVSGQKTMQMSIIGSDLVIEMECEAVAVVQIVEAVSNSIVCYEFEISSKRIHTRIIIRAK